MAKQATRLRDIIIGILLLLIGGVSLLHNFNILTFNEDVLLLWLSYGLAGLGLVLLVSYFIRPKSIWLSILALCSFFLASIIYISNFMAGQEDLIGVALFLLLALGFFAVFVSSPSQWWGLLVGWICVGLAGAVYASETTINIPVLRDLPDNLMSPLLLFSSITIGFLLVWVMSPRGRWWALLTAGMIAAVESVIVLDFIDSSSSVKPVTMFLVAGITFFLIWMLRNEEYKLGWAIYPALVLICFSAFLYMVTFWMNNSRLVLSLIFIALGLIFLLNYFRSRLSAAKTAPAAPAPQPAAEKVYERSESVSDKEFWGDDSKPEPKTTPSYATSIEERQELVGDEEETESPSAEPLEALPANEDVRPPLDYAVEPEPEDDPDKKKDD
jgi:hypothetical protein